MIAFTNCIGPENEPHDDDNKIKDTGQKASTK